jgi:hypothetical protein
MPDYRAKRPSSPDDIICEAVDKIAAAYAEAAGTNRAQNVLGAATPGQRLLCAWFFYWDDVTNGGHAQYFANYTSDLWQDAVKACDTFDVPERTILKSAVKLFGDAQPAATPDERQTQLEEIDADKLDDLDAKFNQAPASDEHVRKYIEAHPEEFFLKDKK